MKSIVVYGDVNANAIDGSSVWLVSVTRVLSRLFDEVHLILKYEAVNDMLLSSIEGISNVVIHAPRGVEKGEGLTPEAAADFVDSVVADSNACAVLARGFEVSYQLGLKPRIAELLWAYVTDIPFPPKKLSERNVTRLRKIAIASRRILAQTEAARSYWEGIVQESAGKTVLMPPMIPNELFKEPTESPAPESSPLRLVYAGKLAKEWRTLEMLELPQALNKLGISATLEVIGSKINASSSEPSWAECMREALERANSDSASGVTWVGALSREDSMARISEADIGFGWRSEELDSSLEISTKALEYGAVGTAPLINRTTDHCAVWGEEYPFYVKAGDSIDEIAQTIASNLGQIQVARRVAFAASAEYSMSAAETRLGNAFSRAIEMNAPTNENNVRPCRVVVASHDLKFMGELMDYLQRSSKFEVKQDRWTTLHDHDPEQSRLLAEWADVVFCEWAGPSLAWYSTHKPESTRLVSRLHRFELNGPWMSKVLWTNVDTLVFVSDWVRRTAHAKFKLDSVNTIVLPNTIDLSDFDRPKLDSARFTLGMVGFVPFLKRPDRALELFESLVEEDDRYILRVKGRLPWDYPHVWNSPVEKQLYLEFFNRISKSSKLRSHIVFDGFGADIASWHRGVGFVLSPSQLESFHLAPAEGMAARGVPIFWEREGVEDIFGPFAKNMSTEARIEQILLLGNKSAFESVGQEAREFSKRWDILTVLPSWERILLGDTTLGTSGELVNLNSC
ncbi:glycosyltransferase [Corynebacterium sp. Marseille-Q2823]|uniref:glycosyltransferase n=1 Tax=Corynebacterium sp. Marseille-Q2823 TaxID=2736606 RepID=UPI001588BB0E|nr:glycosyltransferase [Corynebacterium sp. Marseille-Q2823]